MNTALSTEQMLASGQKLEALDSPTPTNPTSAFSWDDDEQGSDEESEQAKANACCSCLYQGVLKKLPSWIKTLLNVIILCIVIIIPGLADYITFSLNRDEILLRLPTHGYIQIGGYSLILWCAFVCACIIVYNLCVLVVFLTPGLLGNLSLLFIGRIPKNFEIYTGYINDLRTYISIFLFTAILNISWDVLYNPNADEYQDQPSEQWRSIIFKIMNALLVAFLFLLLQKFFIQLIALKFHRTAYLDRIKDVNFHIEVVSQLNKVAKKILLKRLKAAAAEEAAKKQRKRNMQKQLFDDSLLTPKSSKAKAGLQKHRRAASADNVALDDLSPQQQAINEQLNQNTVTSMISFGNMANAIKDFTSIPMDSPIVEDQSPERPKKKGILGFKWDVKSSRSGPTSESSESLNQPHQKFLKLAKQIAKGFQLNSKQEAKRIAKRIFEGLSVDPKKLLKMRQGPDFSGKDSPAPFSDRPYDVLILEDFLPYFSNRLDAEKAFKVFDKDDSNTISRQEVKDTVVGLYRERKALSLSLRDVGSAVGKLDIMMSILTFILTVLTALLIFGISLSSFLVTGVSLVLAVTFMIGNSASTMFEGIIFLFVQHPFDVGDRIFIDGNNYIVKELGILSTVLLQWDGQLIYSPNSVLSTKIITNVRRSPNQIDIAEIQVSFDTPMEKLNLLRQKLTEYVQRESKDYVPKMDLNPIEIDYVNKIRIQIFIEHRSNWQDGDKRWSRRNRFLLYLREALDELEISYKKIPQPVSIFHKDPPGRDHSELVSTDKNK